MAFSLGRVMIVAPIALHMGQVLFVSCMHNAMGFSQGLIMTVDRPALPMELVLFASCMPTVMGFSQGMFHEGSSCILSKFLSKSRNLFMESTSFIEVDYLKRGFLFGRNPLVVVIFPNSLKMNCCD